MIRAISAFALIIAHLLYVELVLLMWSIGRSRVAALERSERVFYHSARTILAIVRMTLGVRIDYVPPSAPLPSPSIIIANHQSYFDIPIIRVFFRRQRIRFIVKRALRRGFPAVSRLMRIQRHAFIERHSSPLTTMKTIRAFAIGLSKKRCSPVIFPEGTRSKGGGQLPFLSAGLRQMVAHLDAPIVAVVISNSYRLNRLFRLRPLDTGRAVRIEVLAQIIDPAEKRQAARQIDILEQKYRQALRARQ